MGQKCDKRSISTKSTGTSTQSLSSTATSTPSHSLSSSHASSSHKNAISEIDSTLKSLDTAAADQFPFSSEHRARPISSSVASSTKSSHNDLARSLGAFSTHPHHSSLSSLYAPGALSHWNNVAALRNPYQTYGAHRSATKAVTATAKDSNDPRKKTYEDKMDKQRLEHILFSGDNSGPLNQQKERMRQKLERKNRLKQ